MGVKVQLEQAYIDDSDQLWVARIPQKDPFAQPNAPDPEPVYHPTAYTYEPVVTYGWPLSVWWPNNTAQFGTDKTARILQQALRPALRDVEGVDVVVEEVKVGPYRWAPMRLLEISDFDGPIVRINAGEAALQRARYPYTWERQMRVAIEAALLKRQERGAA